MPSLLTLPAEVRLQIYDSVFDAQLLNHEIRTGRLFSAAKKPDLDLLLSCWQIFEESRERYYAGTLLRFRSIEDFCSRMKHAPKYTLPLIRHVCIRGIEFDRLRDLEDDESTSLIDLFSKLPNLLSFGWDADVRQFATCLPSSEFAFCCQKIEGIAMAVSTKCPRLTAFGLISLPINMGFLLNFENLQVLHVTGYDRTAPEGFRRILKRLDSLEAMIIEDSIAMHYLYEKQTFGVPTYASFTADALLELNQLKYLSLVAEDNAGFEATFMTPEIIDAIALSDMTLKFLRLQFRECQRPAAVLESTMALLDQCQQQLKEADICFGLGPPEPMGPPGQAWLPNLLDSYQLDGDEYRVQLKELPTQPYPRAIEISIQTRSGRSKDIGLDKSRYTKPQQHPDNKNWWISYQVR
jgi:hypothetical protein